MFKWLDRRKHIRRDQDMRDRMEKAIEDKRRTAMEALDKMNQFQIDRRKSKEEYYGPERRAHA